MARKKAPKIEEDEAQPELIGYARVSTLDQSYDQQITALKAYGVKDDFLFVDKMSAVSGKRKGWELAKKAMRRGDTLVVYALSRLGRSTEHLLKINNELLAEGVALKSLTEPIDTSTADGKLLFTVRAAFAQFERDITIERTKAGLEERKRAGFKLGRPPKLTDKQKAAVLKDLETSPLNRAAIAKKYGVSDSTIKYHFPRPRHAYVIDALKRKGK